jgi:hypothetical protein
MGLRRSPWHERGLAAIEGDAWAMRMLCQQLYAEPRDCVLGPMPDLG